MPSVEEWEAWVPRKAIEELTVRRALADVEDPVRIANQLLKETLPIAVMGMTHMAIHEPNPALRFQAQKYVIDRSMGTTNNPTGRPTDDRPAWEKIFESVAVAADEVAEAE
jgi:hypothetical protein